MNYIFCRQQRNTPKPNLNEIKNEKETGRSLNMNNTTFTILAHHPDMIYIHNPTRYMISDVMIMIIKIGHWTQLQQSFLGTKNFQVTTT